MKLVVGVIFVFTDDLVVCRRSSLDLATQDLTHSRSDPFALPYLRVAVRYDASNVNMEIVDSRGLKQSEDRIHKRAFVWLRQLEQRVRRALGTLASRA